MAADIYQEKPLHEVLEFYNGKSVKQGGTGLYPIYGSNGIIGGSDDYKYENAVILGRVGAYCGSVAYCPTKFWASDNTIVVTPKKGAGDVRYYYYLLTHLDLHRWAGGAAQPLLTQTVLKTVEAPIAESDTQQKIASILSAYDHLIENNLKRIKILEEMAQMIYRKWFVNFRFPGHEKVKMVKSELGMIPEGWETVPLENVCKRITDGSHFSPKSVSDGLPMASVKDMHDWGFNLDSSRNINREDFDTLVRNDCKPLKNDVLIAKDGSYLKHVFVVEKDLDLVILSSIAILRPNDKIQPYFLAFYLKDLTVKARLKGYVSGVALPRIILKDFRNFKILLPPVVIQERWANHVSTIIEECWTLIHKNENLRKTRDLLLPKLISGEIDVYGLDMKASYENN